MTQPPFLNVKDWGAVGDGSVLDTQAIQAAIDSASDAGGGTVFFPAGKYLSGSIFLRSSITLNLEAGAVLLGSQDPAVYPVVDGRWEGSDQKTHASLIAGDDLNNIAVVGRGTIDGQGDAWWDRHRQKKLLYPRPRLIGFTGCRNVLIEGITAVNSPSWTINPVRCENVNIDKVIINNPHDSPNTDGINPDSCRNVSISNCYVSAGDDCVSLKSGTEDNGRLNLTPCENITITNCTMARGHGGVVIGSEMSGGVRRVVISNCVFTGTDRGIRMKSRRGRGGVIEDVRVSNIIMENVLCPLTMNLYYAPGAWGNKANADKNPHPVSDATPRFRNIHLSHITARDVKYAAAFLYGLAEMPLQNISLHDIDISLALASEVGFPEMADDMEKMGRAGMYIHNVQGLSLDHVQIHNQLGPAIQILDACDVELLNCFSSAINDESPFVRLENVSKAYVDGCRTPAGGRALLEVSGKGSKNILLGQHNQVDSTSTVITTGGALPDAITQPKPLIKE
jgi:polygalacturonase